jgi:hypothetical protein
MNGIATQVSTRGKKDGAGMLELLERLESQLGLYW